MKSFLILLLLAMSSTLVSAQGKYQDVVYLKNGSVIRGMVIEQIPNVSIKIETADKNLFVYKMEEIEKITKELSVKKGGGSGSGGLTKGYVGIVETGYQAGIGDYGAGRLKVNVINGYQFNPYFSAGVGIGLRYYTDAGDALLPVFLDLRANFIDGPISPYVSVATGYTLDVGDGLTGVGLLLNPTAGVRFGLSNKISLHVGVGYEMQRISILVPYYSGFGYGYGYNTGSANSGGLGFNVGVTF